MRISTSKLTALLATIAFCLVSHSAARANLIHVTFEDVPLPSEQFVRVTGVGPLTIETPFPDYDIAVSRKREVDDVFQYWNDGDYTVVEGGGSNASEQWLAAYSLELPNTPGNIPVFVAPEGGTFRSVDVNNVAVLDYAVRNGLYGARAFEEGDYLRVRFRGLDASNQATGLVTPWVDLATYTQSLVVRAAWETVYFAPGTIRFNIEFEGTDNDSTWGLNTPTYLAMDNVVISVVPEPSSILLLGFAILPLVRRRQRECSSLARI